jgi:hypothetical protein
MRKRELNAGTKPKVAFSNQEAAQENIRTKCELLEQIVGTSRGPRIAETRTVQVDSEILDALPSSVRQFNAWTSESLPAILHSKSGDFTTNAQATLKGCRYFDRVQSVVDFIKLLKDAPSGASTKEGNLAYHKRETKLAIELRLIAERVIIDLKREVIRLRNDQVNLERKLASATQEAASLLKAARARIAELEKGIKPNPSNVVSLGGAKPRGSK